MLPATISWLAALTVWPEPARADVHDGLADRLEHRLGGLEVRRVAADHDRQAASIAPGLAAGDRGVQHPDAAASAAVGEATGTSGGCC